MALDVVLGQPPKQDKFLEEVKQLSQESEKKHEEAKRKQQQII